MAVSIKDIAARVGVTDATVSMALRDNAEISLKRRDEIKKIAREMGYQPHMMARGLRNGRSRLLSVVFPWNVPQIMDTAEKVASELGYGLMVQFTPQPDPKMERMSLQTVMERRVEGILWQPQPGNPRYNEVLNEFKQMGIKVVLLESSHLNVSDVDVFDFDIAGGFKLAVDHLIERGYKRIIYLATSYIHQHYRNYLKSFALATSSVSVPVEVRCADTPSQAGLKILDIVAAGEMPVGIVCENDWIALEIIKISRKHKINIPQQVGLITTLDMVVGGTYPIGEITWPTISAVSKPLDQLTRQAMEFLIKRVQTNDEGPGEERLMPMELIVRESTNL